MLVYELVAGTHPWWQGVGPMSPVRRIPDVRELRSDCPSEVARFMARALAPCPAERPTSAKAFRAGLFALLEALPGVRTGMGVAGLVDPVRTMPMARSI
jgi:hypothetical protein